MINSIKIVNFRSIESCELLLSTSSSKNCTILLGKNGTGKSSILKAIALLNPDTKFDYTKDCNKKGKKEGADIDVVFKLDFSLLEQYKDKFIEFGIPKYITKLIEFEDFTFSVRISKSNVYYSYGLVYIKKNNFSKYLITKDTKKISVIPNTILQNLGDNISQVSIAPYIESNLELLTDRILESLIEENLADEFKSLMPRCVFWENSKEYLINERINLNEFKLDPTISVPLLNIFKISGITDIDSRIDLIVDDYEERVQLRDELSSGITNYINQVWAEHPINFVVEIENMVCTVMVEDKDDRLPKYSMEQRSDGFKQFISILLNLSSTDESSKLILMDEPEVHLHPSGIKYLRDELLSISKSNTVIISTHSIYMIDKLNLDRHIKVYKEKSSTKLKNIDKNNPYEEEVIYEALGTSIYEHIKPNMVLFEGKTDLDIFSAISSKFLLEIKPINVGYISTDGVEKIPQYVKFIDGKFVKGFVILDSDSDGLKVKKQLLKDDNSFNESNIFTINDIVTVKDGATLEDLYPVELIVEVVKDTYDVLISLDTSSFTKQLDKKNKELNGTIIIKDLKSLLCQRVLADVKTGTKKQIIEKYPLLYEFVSKAHFAFKNSQKISNSLKVE